jgi:hypothetical protein
VPGAPSGSTFAAWFGGESAAPRTVTDPADAEVRQRRLTWSQLIRKVCEIDPLRGCLLSTEDLQRKGEWDAAKPRESGRQPLHFVPDPIPLPPRQSARRLARFSLSWIGTFEVGLTFTLETRKAEEPEKGSKAQVD